MAITYKIYESGFNKVIDVLNDGSVIGKKKFIPKAAVAVQDGNIKIKDAVTNSLEFEGSFESFVDSEGNNFGSIEAINDFLSSIPINISELRGLELIDGALAQDLSPYATIEYVDDEIVGEELARDAAIQILRDYVDEQIAALQAQIDAIDGRIETVETEIAVMPQTLFLGDPFNFVQSGVEDSEPVYVNASNLYCTFTTTETGKVAIMMEGVNLSYGASGSRTWMYVTTTDPTPFGNGNIQIDKYVDEQAYALDWFENLVDTGQVDVVNENTITFANFLSASTGGDPIEVTKNFTIPLTLAPNTSYTFYFWMVPVVWGVSGQPRINASIANGIKVMEVLDI